jgi:hypothetical protein
MNFFNIGVSSLDYSGKYVDELSVGRACRYFPVVATEL